MLFPDNVLSAVIEKRIMFALPGVAQWIEWIACEPKGRQFDSYHMPELRTRSPVGGAREATTH